MRIVAGLYKGIHFQPPKGFNARPTTDFAKEALFNILESQYDISSFNVLDLFAGSGSISYEFCSRKALSVTAIDINRNYIKYISQNLNKFGCKNARAVCIDSFTFIKKSKVKYDLVFCDPPFSFAKYSELYEAIVDYNILMPNAILIIEHPKATDFSSKKYFIDKRKYGHVCFSLFSGFEEKEEI
ncbi:MAG TPA: 16S rRNA (guanine(966)-N(2))-methyltransferase RsmD [Bacteroidales bacterium]|nr:16S rRNA (guanine(966)-N(2))-methyltransferase RsmD [Bacteroidales bacterium]